MARRTIDARGRDDQAGAHVVGLFGPEMAGDVLLPGAARIAPTTFDDWLAAGATP